MFKGDLNDLYEWGVKKPFSFCHFLQIEVLVIPLYDLLKDGVVWSAGLDDYFPLRFSSPRPSSHLGDLLKSPFPGSKIWEIKNAVRVYDPYYSYFIKIQPLCDHLSTHQNVHISRAKIFQYPLIAIFAARSVQIHPRDPCFGK